MESIFKAYDIRGKVGSELYPDVLKRIGQALAQWLPSEGPVAVGYDMRPDSLELATALIAGINAAGRNAVNIGQVTSDMIYFAVGANGYAGGAMVTASHNPGEYNGVKLCREEARPISIDSGLADIREQVIANTFSSASQPGKVSGKDVLEPWIQHVMSFIDADKLKPLKIAVDAGNGMAGKTFAELEPYVPFEVSEMYFELDGTFPNHEANPLKFETLKDLIALIRKQKLDGGIAFDGDGDRAFLIDETGEVLTGGVMSAMLAEYFLALHPGSKIVHDARNSRSVPSVINENGGEPVRTRVGHSFIKQAMREVDAPFGGEASGHYYFRGNWYADSGLIAAVIGLYVLSTDGGKLSDIRKRYTRYAAISETNFKIKDKDRALRELTDKFKQVGTVDTLDGLTISFDDASWFNVRGSNTEPLIRLNAEATTPERLQELVDEVRHVFGVSSL